MAAINVNQNTPDTHMGPGRTLLVVPVAVLANGDTTAPVPVLGYDAVSLAVNGTFGAGGSVTLEGSYDNVTYYGVQAAGSGSAIAITAAGMAFAVSAAYRFVRARVTAGDGTTALNVNILLRSQSRS